LFQALLLAHGGLTTLGANVFSMGIAGPLVAYTLFRAGRLVKLPQGLTLFLAATLADLATYLTTSLQLALAFPDPIGGFAAALAKFAGIFAVTQLPLAVSEGLLTVLIFNVLVKHSARELHDLGLQPAREGVRP
jgi:cobalt/nickel transport system permease protein